MKPIITLRGFNYTKILRESITEEDRNEHENTGENPLSMNIGYGLSDDSKNATLIIKAILLVEDTKYEVELEGFLTLMIV